MKFSNGTEFRFGMPKYKKIWGRLICAAGVFSLLSWFIGEPAKGWIAGVGSLMVLAALLVALAGTIAERKEWESNHKGEK